LNGILEVGILVMLDLKKENVKSEIFLYVYLLFNSSYMDHITKLGNEDKIASKLIIVYIICNGLSNRYSIVTETCVQVCISKFENKNAEKCASLTKLVNRDWNFPFPCFNHHLSGSSPVFMVRSLRFVNWSKNKLKFENPTQTN